MKSGTFAQFYVQLVFAVQNDVYNNIANQEAHHNEKTFHQEYNDYPNENEMVFDERFLFEFIEDSL